IRGVAGPGRAIHQPRASAPPTKSRIRSSRPGPPSRPPSVVGPSCEGVPAAGAARSTTPTPPPPGAPPRPPPPPLVTPPRDAPGRDPPQRGRSRQEGQQDRVLRAVGRAPIAGDIAGVADAICRLEREARAGGNEVIEVEHLTAAVEERVVRAARDPRVSDDL